jgi:Xaa-Pro aminopeptidase
LGITGRLQRLRQLLLERSLDGILVTQPENCRYLSGFTGSGSYAGTLLITQEVNLLATDFIHFEQAKQEAPDFDIIILRPASKRFGEILSDYVGKNLGFESNAITFAEANRLAEAAQAIGIKPTPTEGIVESLRAVKDPTEIAFIQEAARLADAAMQYMTDSLKPGVSEKSAAWTLEKYLRDNGSEHMPFDIIVASGPNAALPHAKPTDRTILGGEPVICDLGARFHGYASDLSRTFYLGHPDEVFTRVYDLVLSAQTRAILEMRTGMTGSEVDTLARSVIQEGGYGEFFGHGLGHGVGLAVHEEPRLGQGSTDDIAEDMVFTVEPAIYIPGWGGVRIEDTVVIHEGKARPLTMAPKQTASESQRAA